MIKSKKHLCFVLKISLIELKQILKKTDDYYQEFETPKYDNDRKIKVDNKGNTVFRKICQSLEPLKRIQKQINKNFLKTIVYPGYIQGGIKNRDNVTNARNHLGKKYHFITDLKDFFPSITAKRVYALFIKLGFSADVSRMLARLTTYKNQVPQGAPTSTYIANLLFMETDKKLYSECSKRNIIYTRFIDDLVFSSQNDFQEFTKDIINIVKDSKFRINHKKTKYKTGKVIITGVLTRNNVIDVTDNFKEKLKNTKNTSESEIKGYENYYKKVRKKVK